MRIATAVLSTAVALLSYRYLAGIGPRPPTIVANLFARPWLLIHVAGAATALLVGSVQFSGALRTRWPLVHRRLGRIYVLGCLAGGASGLILAFGATAGPIATAGFGLLAVGWMITNVQGWRYAVPRHFADHRAWMIRPWALTLSAVTLRIYLSLISLLGLPFVESYRAISFLCWIPNLLLAEAFLRGWPIPVLQTRIGYPTHLAASATGIRIAVSAPPLSA